MKHLLLFVIISFFFNHAYSKVYGIRFVNECFQEITNLEYLIGSKDRGRSGNMDVYSSFGLVKTGDTSNFIYRKYKKHYDFIKIKYSLIGGGFIEKEFALNKYDLSPVWVLKNVASPIDTTLYDDFKNTMQSLSLNDGFDINSLKNIRETKLGSFRIKNKAGEIIYEYGAEVLKTVNTEVAFPQGNITIHEKFSRQTIAETGINIPFFQMSGGFEDSDMADLKWEIENIGLYHWKSPDGRTIDQIIMALPEDSKQILFGLIDKGFEIFFINEILGINRISFEKIKSTKLGGNIEINVANYVTGSGNHMLDIGSRRSFTYQDIVCDIREINLTEVTKNIYELDKLAKAFESKKETDIRASYDYFQKAFPDRIPEVDNLELMKKILKEINDSPALKMSYIK